MKNSKKNMANLKKFKNEIFKGSGASYGIYNGVLNPTTGFLASFQFTKEVYKEEKFKENADEIIKGFVETYSDQLLKFGYYLGGWCHEGKVYLDVSKQFLRREDAIAFAESNEQLAIWDAENNKSILL